MSIQQYRDVYMECIGALDNIYTLLQPKIPTLRELQLTSRQEMIILLFFRNDRLTMSDMAERLNISKSAVSQAMRKLEQEDLLIRSVNEQNRRESKLSLGAKGESLKKQFERFEAAIIQDYVSQLDIQEIQQVRDTLVKLESIIQTEENNRK